jgi:hypothetical protein
MSWGVCEFRDRDANRVDIVTVRLTRQPRDTMRDCLTYAAKQEKETFAT